VSEELKTMLEAQNRAWAEFRQANDARIAQLEQKGAADVVTVEKVDRIGVELDKFGDQLKALEKLASRPGRGVDEPEVLAARQRQLDEANGYLQSLAGIKGVPTAVFKDTDSLIKYGRDFGAYLKRGDAHAMAAMNEWVRQDFQIATETDGGFLVPPDLTGRMVRRLYERSDIRAIANVQNTTASELSGIEDIADIDAGWRGETDAVTDNATGSQFGRWTIQVEEMWTQPKVSTRLLADAMMDVESWLMDKIADKLARLENTAFVAGNGIRKPRGITTYPTAATSDGAGRAWGTLEYIATGYAGGFAASLATAGAGDSLFNVVQAVKPAYRRNARWVASRYTLREARKLKTTYGEYLWSPAEDMTLASGISPTLLGYQVTEAEDMPLVTTSGALCMAFGDFAEGYTIADRAGITVLRDPYTAKGYVRFYTTKRVGGGVVNFDAIKLLKSSAS